MIMNSKTETPSADTKKARELIREALRICDRNGHTVVAIRLAEALDELNRHTFGK